MEIGNKIKQYRMKCNLTQESLADRLNISPQSISKWENGGTPDIDMIPLIADYFGVSIDYLFGNTTGKFSKWEIDPSILVSHLCVSFFLFILSP